MSIQAMSYVFKDSESHGFDRLVLLSLANHANDLFQSWPAVQTIAAETRMHMRSVQRCLRELERDGEVTPVSGYSRGGRRSTTYELTKCKEWLANVGPPTLVTTNGNRTVDQRLPNENASTRFKKPPIPGQSARAPLADSAGYPGRLPGMPGQIVKGTPGSLPGLNDISARGALADSTEYPGRLPPEPSLNHHRTTLPPSPPLQGGGERVEEQVGKRSEPQLAPPLMGGQVDTRPMEVRELNLAHGARLKIIKPVGPPLFTPEEKSQWSELTAEQIAEKYREKGWPAEVTIYGKSAD